MQIKVATSFIIYTKRKGYKGGGLFKLKPEISYRKG